MVDLEVEIISVHLPKTAGTTFRQVLLQTYGEEQVFKDYKKQPFKQVLSEIKSQNIRAIHGHFKAEKYEGYFPNAKRIIWLREPIKRFISNYWHQVIFFQKRTILLNEVELEKEKCLNYAKIPQVKNYMSSYFRTRRLEDFWFVGITEFFEEDLTEIQTLMGWPEVKIGATNKHQYPQIYRAFLASVLSDPEAIEELRAINRKDVELYERALNLRENRRKSYGLSDNALEIKSILSLQNTRPSIPTVSIFLPELAKRDSRIEASLGRLREVVIEGETMELTGWAVSLVGNVLDGFQVSIGDRQITEWEETLGIPSPEVKKAYPDLANAANAGFSLRVHLHPDDVQKCYDSPIAVTPRFGDRQGSILFNVFAPSLKLPDRSELKKIGINNPNNFQQHAWRWLGFLVQRVGLLPTDRLLDVGCGLGNIAYGLAYYLTNTGGYEGFDVIDQSWGLHEVGIRKPNFHFCQEDIHHPMYNPSGKIPADEFVFPYPQESFELVCIINLFTHLREAAVSHYLKQTSLVLKPGGRCVCTCFLINSESKEAIAFGNSDQNLVYEMEGAFTKDPELPEKAIGFPEVALERWIADSGLMVVDKYYGFWSGRNAMFGPDMLVLEKKYPS